MKRQRVNHPHKPRYFFTITVLFTFIITILIADTSVIMGARAGLESKIALFTASADDKLERSLGIDEKTISIEATITPENIDQYSAAEFETLIDTVDVIFVNRFLPSDAEKMHTIKSYINGTNSNKGMVLFGLMEGDLSPEQIEIINPVLPVNLTDYKNSTEDLSNINYEISVRQVSNVPEESKILTDTIQWNSFPSVDRRTKLKARSNANIIVETVPEVTGDDPYTILADWNSTVDAGRVMFFACEIIDKNIAVPLWPYFNYFVYTCTFHVHPGYGSNSIESFQDWPHSPIPHTTELIGWFSMIAVLWFVTFYGFYRVKKVSRPWKELQAIDRDKQRQENNNKDSSIKEEDEQK